jgi:hypothetical protein
MFGVMQWTTQYYKMFLGESVHEHGMFSPPFLISHRTLVIPLRPLLFDHDKVWHFPTSGYRATYPLNLTEISVP